MQQVSTIKGWLLIVVVSVVAVPLCTLFFLYPSCSGLIAGQAGHEAVQLATHLFKNNPAAATLTRESLPPDFSRHIEQAVGTGIEQIKTGIETPYGPGELLQAVKLFDR